MTQYQYDPQKGVIPLEKKLEESLADAVVAIKQKDYETAETTLNDAVKFVEKWREQTQDELRILPGAIAITALVTAVVVIWVLGHSIQSEYFVSQTLRTLTNFMDHAMFALAVVGVIALLVGTGWAGGYAAGRLKVKRGQSDEPRPE